MSITRITPTASAVIEYRARLMSPFHHGAGSAGNTSLLRTQPVIQPDGGIAHVPFLSAGSIRHALRDALAWRFVRVAGVDEGSLSKAAVDLLWTGGAVTTTGAQTDLALARRVEQVLPHVAMLGYAARSDIVAGTLRASDAILVCRENAARLPGVDEVDLLGAAAYRDDEFGTRHDIASTPVARMLDAAAGAVGTTQMIWDTQILVAGSVLAGDLALTPAATRAHEMVLGAAVALWAPGGVVALGAKTGQGMGRAELEGVNLAVCADALTEWEQHVSDHRVDAVELIRELTP